MRNRIVGGIIVGISLFIGLIVLLFNRALTTIVNESCSHGPSCPMWGTIDVQTKIGISIMVFVIIIGLYLIFFGEEKKIVTKIKKVKEQIKERQPTIKNYQDIFSKLSNDEKSLLEKVIEAKGSIYQSALIEKTGFSKVKVTRLLDRLEGRAILERKRRGMTNIILLKH